MNKNARLYQVTAPSRSSNPDYRNLNDVLGEEIAKMNRRLPEEDHIVHLDKGIQAPQNYRFMKEIDVMLVTPLEDGMNLVAFEYILSQKYRQKPHRGLLVLSTSGASRVLKQKGFGEEDGIVYVNPMRTKAAGQRVADALKRNSRISDRIVKYVETERRVDDWAEQNIEAIRNSRKEP
jgi:trehalose 6-phosphate synthase